jgi:hypothetical protein
MLLVFNSKSKMKIVMKMKNVIEWKKVLLKNCFDLDEFDCYVDFFWYTDTHDSSHNSFFRVNVD